MDINLEAEESLLGCILKKGDLIKEIALEEKHFYSKPNKILFQALRELEQKNDPIDIVTVITTVGQSKLSDIGGKQYLSKLMNSIASLEPFKTYEKYILESYKIRRAREIQQQDIKDSNDLSNIMKELSELELENTDDDYNHKEALTRLYDKIINQAPGLSGIDTGFRDLNRMLDGFQDGDLIISAARPSVGKTAKMLNHAIKHCENGGLSVIFSLEMGEDSLNKRMWSTIGRIDGHKMRRPNELFDSDDWSKLTNAMGVLSNMNIHIYDKSGQTVPYIRSKVNKLKKQYPDTPMLIMIDYLQLIRSVGKVENRTVEVGEISRSLKELARDAKAPVYLLSQLSRGVESRQDKRPMLSDLRESGSIEQDADVIEFLYRDDYYDKETEKQNIIEVIIAKQRNGSVGTVELAFIKEYNAFLDLDYRYES
ncbi:replicative DNA helicase [Virgibacillus salexigens]|uniref:replicative DNA helicase n=1 Tax=Virgibacillus salexigens TaxID=61016 RepID=UPI00190C69F1|nr:replicative DNA helicase [Virgibacillus salexigens]